jgi:hypothetical protein
MKSSLEHWMQYRREHYHISPFKGKLMREGETDLWQGDSGWRESIFEKSELKEARNSPLYPYIFNDERDG